MNSKKYQVSLVVFFVMVFTMLLFYQNCSKGNTGSLGGDTTFPSGQNVSQFTATLTNGLTPLKTWGGQPGTYTTGYTFTNTEPQTFTAVSTAGDVILACAAPASSSDCLSGPTGGGFVPLTTLTGAGTFNCAVNGIQYTCTRTASESALGLGGAYIRTSFYSQNYGTQVNFIYTSQ